MRVMLAVFSLLLGGTALADVDAGLEQARAMIEARLAGTSRPGVVIGITDGARLRQVVVHGYADLKSRTPLNRDSHFAIGSISKAFTAIALMQLADEGRFDPHAPLSRYLPSFQIRSDYPKITGHDVLSHTAGLPYYLPDTASSGAVLVSLQDFKATYAPGAHFAYSNTGYQVMGYVLERIEGAPYHDIVERRVLKPLGMNASSAIIDDAQRGHLVQSYTRWPYDGRYVEATWFEYLAGDGSIESTVQDMAAYTRFYVNRGQGTKQRLLSARSFTALTTPVLDDYAYGLEVHRTQEHTVISHGGGIAGFISYIEAHPDEGFGLVFLSNGGMDKSLRPWVTELVTAAFAGRPLPPPPPADRDPLTAPLTDYVGHFLATSEGATQALNVRLEQDHLVLERVGDPQRLQRMGIDTFRTVAGSGDRDCYVFARAEDKPDSAVTGVSHGINWFTVVAATASPSPPVSYAAYVGHYVNNGPEGPVARVFVRNGKLFASMYLDAGIAPLPLVPLSEDTFRLGGEDYSPERARFDGLIDGHAQRLTIDGVPLYRLETP